MKPLGLLVRIVLDTGVLVSALITRDTPPDMLYQAWRKRQFDLVTSKAQLEEIERVLSYKKLARFIRREEAMILLDGLCRMTVMADNLPVVTLSPDPADNNIIATAIAGNADYLVSGDKRDLLVLEAAHDIPILTARQMVGVLGIVD